MKKLENIYPKSLSLLGCKARAEVVDAGGFTQAPQAFPDFLKSREGALDIPAYLPELAQLEWVVQEVSAAGDVPSSADSLLINPSLQLLRHGWKNLVDLLDSKENPLAPEEAEEFVLIWKEPATRIVRCRAASSAELLALKIIVEEIDPKQAAQEHNVPLSTIARARTEAIAQGILLAPLPEIGRPADFPGGEGISPNFLASPVFTLQWHITQECDLHCRHCYDRSTIAPVGLEPAKTILADLRGFCERRNVRGHVSLTGGNPLLHPGFFELYREASEHGFSLAVLGNPTSQASLKKIIAMERPLFFQVSLEGLAAYNDHIRGRGHFGRVIKFLADLRELAIPSIVMLTLNRDNLDQVLPLAEYLTGKADLFTFNRLSAVGEGASLSLPEKSAFREFLARYLDAAEKNPLLGLKDNLLNILLRKRGQEPFGGCTGYGCGAAFSFMSVLPNGEAHACRKFPSPLGNILAHGIEKVYESPLAESYRQGPRACRSCAIRPVCGGCLAVIHSRGLNVFEDCDPYCFI